VLCALRLGKPTTRAQQKVCCTDVSRVLRLRRFLQRRHLSPLLDALLRGELVGVEVPGAGLQEDKLPEPVAAFLCGGNLPFDDDDEDASVVPRVLHLGACMLHRVAVLVMVIRGSANVYGKEVGALKLFAVARELVTMAIQAASCATAEGSSIPSHYPSLRGCVMLF